MVRHAFRPPALLFEAPYQYIIRKPAYDVYVGKLGFKVNTDAKMDKGMRWLTVGARSPMIHADLIRLYQAILEADAMGAGVWECDDCQKTYEELRARVSNSRKRPRRSSTERKRR